MSESRSIASAQLKVGLEIHVELATASKMFTRISSVAHPDNFDAQPNSLIDPMTLALPGALPVMNRAAVEMAMMVGLALNCQIAPLSTWDRKQYFYPDLPKGYQISQYDLPLCFDGEVNLRRSDGSIFRVGIIRAHLEEDTGKLGHELPGGLPYDGSLVDYNRAGTPLLEIVTEPDFQAADDVVVFARELRTICRFLGVTHGVMQRGHMRFEPNINVIITTDAGREFATPIVEVKNLNSFKSLRSAIEHEFSRQVEQWQRDGLVQGPGAKSTRGWDDGREITQLQREKEDAHDYRYFPDPDLVPVVVSDQWRDSVAARIPELPAQRRQRYRQEYGLTEQESLTLTDDAEICLYFEACIAATAQVLGGEPTETRQTHAALVVAKWLLNPAARRANERGVAVHELGVTPQGLAQIMQMREQNTIGSNAAETLFDLLCDPANQHRQVTELAREHRLLQVRDTEALDEWIAQALAAQPQAAADFASGKDAALGRLVGQVMKISKGQADATAVGERLRQELRKPGSA